MILETDLCRVTRWDADILFLKELCTGVDRGFSSSHRHVGCVGYKGSTLHNGHLSSVNLSGEFREITEYLYKKINENEKLSQNTASS